MIRPAIHTVPSVSARLSGRELSEQELSRIASCRLTQACGLPDQVELSFHDAAPAGAVPGSEIELRLDHELVLFAGTLTAVRSVLGTDGAAAARVRGYDRLHALRVCGSVRAWHEVTLHDIAAELAGRAGLTVAALPGADPATPVLHHVIQHGQSDLQLLAMLAERLGLGFRTRGSTLEFYRHDRGTDAPLDLRWGEQLREAVVEDNLDTAARPVRVATQDFTRVASYTGRADSGRGTARSLGGLAAYSAQDADLLAAAESGRRTAAAGRVRGVAEGDLRLRPGAVVRIGAEGRSYRPAVLTRVEHRLDDAGGFTSTFDSEPVEQAPPSAAGAVVNLATVAALDDAGGAGRVRVSLDAYDGAETAFLPVVTAGAGAGGLVALPEVGSRVVVLSDALDPGQGVVLGGVYPARLPDPALTEGRTHVALWTTPDGQRIELDDHEHTMVVTDRGGSRLELAPGKVRLHAAGDLELSAPGGAIRVTAASVDFVQG